MISVAERDSLADRLRSRTGVRVRRGQQRGPARGDRQHGRGRRHLRRGPREAAVAAGALVDGLCLREGLRRSVYTYSVRLPITFGRQIPRN